MSSPNDLDEQQRLMREGAESLARELIDQNKELDKFQERLTKEIERNSLIMGVVVWALAAIFIVVYFYC